MSEPRKPVVSSGVSTRVLEIAVSRLHLERYPARLAAIDGELRKRNSEMQMSVAATGSPSEIEVSYAQRRRRAA